MRKYPAVFLTSFQGKSRVIIGPYNNIIITAVVALLT